MTVYLLRRKGLGKTSCAAIAALSKTGIEVYRNDKALPEGGTCIRWGCTSNVPTKDIINNAAGIHQVNDKTGFRIILNKHGLSPLTVTAETDPNDKGIVDAFTYPAIVRPRHHNQGRRLYVAHNQQQLFYFQQLIGEGWYASPFIDKVSEYRVFCMQGRALCVARKTPADPKAVAWNVAQGGRFDNVRWDDWPMKAVRTALEAHTLTSLDFSGVDIMVDKNGACYVLEANSAPSLTSPYRQECFAKGLDSMIQKGSKDDIPLSKELGGYKKFIHPAICPEACV